MQHDLAFPGYCKSSISTDWAIIYRTAPNRQGELYAVYELPPCSHMVQIPQIIWLLAHQHLQFRPIAGFANAGMTLLPSVAHTVLQTQLDPQRPVWASLHEVLDLPGTTTLEAWSALDTAWSAMTGLNTPKEALSHMRHMASSLHRLASTPGWTQLNFPMGLSMAVMLHIRR